MNTQFDVELDCRGLSCSMPVLKTKKALDEMEGGQILKMVSTDAGSKSDVRALIKRTGHELITVAEKNREFTFMIKKGH